MEILVDISKDIYIFWIEQLQGNFQSRASNADMELLDKIQERLYNVGYYSRGVWLINSLAPGGFDYSLKLVNFKLISTMNIWGIFCEMAIRWMSQNFTDHKSTLVQVMAWFFGAVRQQAITWASVDLDPCRHMTSLGHNELRPSDAIQAEGETSWSTMVQVIDWHLVGPKPLPEPMLIYGQLNPKEQSSVKC